MKIRKSLILGSILFVSISILDFSTINKVKADIRYFANENGQKEKCIYSKNKSFSGSIDINLDAPGGRGAGVSFASENQFWRGGQASYEDASLWYACRQHCTVVNWNPLG